MVQSMEGTVELCPAPGAGSNSTSKPLASRPSSLHEGRDLGRFHGPFGSEHLEQRPDTGCLINGETQVS